jgi:predicted HicB family RNase H-like nuclease
MAAEETERTKRPLHVYIPIELYARASAAAKKEQRSLTAFVERSLKSTLDLAEQYGPWRGGGGRRR